MLLFDTSSLSASIVLVVMACVSLAISLSFRQKSRALRKFPEDVQASTFKKTFNVFSPYAEKRRILHEQLELLILVAVYGSFMAISFAVLKIFEFGFLLAFFTLIMCLGFLLIDETLDVQKNANLILSALKKKTSFGKGDVEVLDFLRKTLPRLSNYHLMVAFAFLATSFAVPSVVKVFLFVFSGWAGLIFAAGALLWFFPPFVLLFTALMFGATVFVVQSAANRVKMRIFSFPSSERLNVISEQFYRMKMFVRVQHHHPSLQVPDVPEPEKAEEQEVESSES
jgi:hypothetical protein